MLFLKIIEIMYCRYVGIKCVLISVITCKISVAQLINPSYRVAQPRLSGFKVFIPLDRGRSSN